MALLVGSAAAAAAAVKKWYYGGQAAWELLPVQGCSPEPRSLHAAAVLGGKMYIVGGCCYEKYMNDVLVLDLEEFNCSQLPFPVSCAGHSLIATENALIALVGIPSDQKLRVYKFNTISWSAVATSGDAPEATRGHSATLIQNQIWVIGGEDFRGHLHGDVHRLDLESMRWDRIDASGSVPSPRSFHGAAMHKDHSLYLFGGQTTSGSSDGLYHVDVAKMHWSCEDSAHMSKVFFANAVIGNNCYVVGGGTAETLSLNMSSLKWSVVSVDPRLALEGPSLVHAVINGGDVLIAAGSNHAAQFQVFMLKTMKAYSLPVQVGRCLVRAEDGSLLGLFDVPREGKLAGEIEVAVQVQRLRPGYLERGGTHLTRSDLIFPGQELRFCEQPGSIGTSQTDFKLALMDVRTCKEFMSLMKIKVITGEGWLEPLQEIQAPAFQWKKSHTSLQDQLEYLWLHATPTKDIFLWRDVETGVQEVSGCDDEYSYRLQFEVNLVVRYMNFGLVAMGFWVVEEVNKVYLWRALVALLALNIKNHSLKPWMVISDLKEEWYFAWMDGSSMFVCKAFSRAQALGILHDLGGDYDKVTTNSVYGLFSNLPSVFSRIPVNLFCDTSSEELHPILFDRSPTEGGILLSCTNGKTAIVTPEDF